MATIVHQLKENAKDENYRVSRLLRDALVVARKLNDSKIELQINNEMKGYEKEVPAYRKLEGIVKAQNLVGRWVPMRFHGALQKIKFSESHVGSPIPELERLLETHESGEIIMPFNKEIIDMFRKEDDDMIHAGVFLAHHQIHSIIDNVRYTILEWALDLPDDDIPGDTAASKEFPAIPSQTFNIGTLQGIVGNVASTNVQIGNYNAIHDLLKKSGVPQAERNELENIIDEANSLPEEKRSSLKHRASEWLGRNKSFLLTGAVEVTKLLHELKVF